MLCVKLKNILVPYDGTASSNRAFRYALDLAQNHDGKILILTCIKDKATFGFFKLKSDKKIMEKQKNNAKKKITQLKKYAEKFNVCLKSNIVKSDIISESIIKHARKAKIDLIVMSKTKRGTVAERVYTESVVDRVLENLPCTFVYVK